MPPKREKEFHHSGHRASGDPESGFFSGMFEGLDSGFRTLCGPGMTSKKRTHI
jgi:hypothetical protein